MGSKHFLADLMMMLLLLLVFLLDLRERKREGDYSPSIKGSQFSFPLLSHLENVSQQCIFVIGFSVTYLFLYVKVNSQNIPSQFFTILAQFMCN